MSKEFVDIKLAILLHPPEKGVLDTGFDNMIKYNIIGSANHWCGHVTFLSLNKKVTKEISQRGATKMRPLWKPPPLRHPVSKNVPIFEHLLLKDLQVFLCRHPKIGTFSSVGWRCARRGFLRGHAFSECPLKSPSFGTFLGETRPVHNSPDRLQKTIGYCRAGASQRRRLLKCIPFNIGITP